MLTLEQIAKLHRVIVQSFPGAYADQEFASFSSLRVGILLDRVTPANGLFSTKVRDFLQHLNGQQVYRALNQLKQERPDDDELEKVINDILTELGPVDRSFPPEKQEQSALPPLRLLVANSKMDTKFAQDIKKHLQEVMDDWDIVGTWETGQRSPDDIETNAAIIALVANIAPQKGVTDPPLRTVEAAWANLDGQHRLVLVAYDPRAFNWVQEQIRDRNLKNFVDAEPFFGPDGQPLFFSQYRDAEIEYRVRAIGMKLSERFSQARNLAGAAKVASAVAATANRSTVPIIVLGEPQGLPTLDARASIQALIAALNNSGLEFSSWPDDWRIGREQATGLLVKDPIFIRTVGDAESKTARVAEDLDKALRSVFNPMEETVDLLSDCRRVLWRPGGPPWELVGDTSDPSRADDDLDNIETRVAQPGKFVKWLERFAAPDAVILHEALGEQRPAGLIRVLRQAIVESLSVPGRKALVRLRAFKELPDFGNDPLTIVAVDDLPLAAGIDLREKAKSRFDQFRFKIERILEQKRFDTDDPAVLRVAILTQGVALFQGESADQDQILRGWKPFRVWRDGPADFRADINDKKALLELTQQLIKGGETAGRQQ